MRIELNLEDATPIYAQVAEQIQLMIAAGQLRPGDQLPTIRQLAADLRVNYNTVAKAYLELDHMDLISTQQGRGTFIASRPDGEELEKMRTRKLEAIVDETLTQLRRLDYRNDEIKDVIDRWLQNH